MSTNINVSAKRTLATPLYFVHCTIALAIMLGFKYLPASAPLTPLGMEVIGIFLGMLYGWLIVGDLFWPSITGMVLLGLSDYTTVAKAFQTGFGNNTVLLLFFFFIFTNIISDAGITNYIALWLSRRKFAQGKPYMLSFLLAFTMFILVFMVSATAGCLIMFPIIKEVARLYGFEPGEDWPKHMIIGATYVACTGYMLLPFKSLPVVVFASYAELSGQSINIGPYILCTIAMTAASMLIFLAVLKFILKPDMSKITRGDVVFAELPPLNGYQKLVFGYFFFIILLLLWPTFAPKSWAATKLISSIGNTGILALSVVIFAGAKTINHRGKVITMQMLCERGITWSLIFLLSAALLIAGAITDESTGVSLYLTAIITPIVAGRSPFLFIFLICLIASVMTALSNNVATAAIFVPIVYTLGQVSGANSAALIICLMNACNIGLATPPASAPASLIHADTEWITGKTAITDGILLTIANLLLIMAVLYPLTQWLL